MKKIILFIITYLLLGASISSAKEYLSKDPNYINRGSLWGHTSVSNYKKNERHKHNYRIVIDPTGTSPFKKVEKFSPRKGDCGNEMSRQANRSDCESGRLRLEIHNSRDKITKKKKPFETWFGYYIFVPEDFPIDKHFAPYITQFYGETKRQRGGHAPQISASIVNGKLVHFGKTIVDEKNLKGKWNKIEFQIKWSIQKDGFVKVYHNGELKSSTENYKTMSHDKVQIKYGTYNHKGNSTIYPEGYQFPGHTIYFAGVSISKTRDKLKVNKIK